MSSLLALSLLALALAVTTGADVPPSFKITSKRPDDRVSVHVEKDQATFSVHSPFGISHAVIERAAPTWPDALILRLHLKGLSNFRATNGTARLDASASLQDGKPLVRLWKDGKEDAPLDAKSPFWMEVRILDSEGKQAKEIPLKDGYFEIQLPRAMFDGNPKAVTVSWIDFYRN